MKILVICGHPNSDFEGVQEILNSAGVGLPKPSRHELISSNELHEKIFRSYELDPSNLDPIAPIKLGKIWQYLAIVVFSFAAIFSMRSAASFVFFGKTTPEGNISNIEISVEHNTLWALSLCNFNLI